MNILKIAGEAFDYAGFKRYFSNTSWFFAVKIFTLAINFIISIYVARYLRTTQYGLISFVVSFASICMTLGDFGIDTLLI